MHVFLVHIRACSFAMLQASDLALLVELVPLYLLLFSAFHYKDVQTVFYVIKKELTLWLTYQSNLYVLI